MIPIVKLYYFILANFFAYCNSFKNNLMKSSVKMIDYKNNKIALFVRGSKNVVYIDIFEAFYDSSILSTLPSNISFEIGYFCGINFNQFSINTEKKAFDYSLHSNSNQSYSCSILAIDRKKNIVFKCNSLNFTKEMHMSPSDIKDKAGLINKFHPIQACYIGLLAGCLQKLRSQNLKLEIDEGKK